MLSIVAVIAVRNEAAYIANCLRHFISGGIQCYVLDNESEDETRAICRRPEFASGLIGLERLPFAGRFSLRRQLEAKRALIAGLEADWVIHADADEILTSCHPGESLRGAIERADEAGFTMLDFDEFVFLPVTAPYSPDHPGPQPIRSYYFFQPRVPRLMRAWKRAANLSNLEHLGHRLTGAGGRLAPERMVLRHYLFTSQDHAFAKYAARQFDPAEVEDGFHRNRINQPVERFRFPAAERLCWLDDPADPRQLDRRRPRRTHYWQWEDGPPPARPERP